MITYNFTEINTNEEFVKKKKHIDKFICNFK